MHPCARKVDAPSFAWTSLGVVDGRATATTTVGPPAVALHRLEAPMIRAERLASANRERKSTLGRIRDELVGTKPAYARGGRQKPRGYDAGGATPPPIAFGSPSLQDIAFYPSQTPLWR